MYLDLHSPFGSYASSFNIKEQGKCHEKQRTLLFSGTLDARHCEGGTGSGFDGTDFFGDFLGDGESELSLRFLLGEDGVLAGDLSPAMDRVQGMDGSK